MKMQKLRAFFGSRHDATSELAVMWITPRVPMT